MSNNNRPEQNSKLIETRNKKGWTQEQLAEEIGVDVKTIQRWEGGRSFPRKYPLTKLCNVFDKTEEELGFARNEAAIVQAEDRGGLQERQSPLQSPFAPSNNEEDGVTHIDVPEVSLNANSLRTTHFPSTQQINPIQQSLEGITDKDREDGTIHVEYSITDQQERKLLFNILRKKYKDKLEELKERRLDKEVIPLGFHECFDLMHPKTRQSQPSKRRVKALPEGTTIETVYDQVTRGLLILGKPGAGKTTLLYRLASALLEKAEQDESRPLPIVLNLSSWAEERLPLSDWVVKELDAPGYHIPQKVGQRWLKSRFQLFLDGLDEVGTEALSACIEEINAYNRESLVPFVVCSREKEYVYSVVLAVQSTIIVQPLTPEQIDAYLVSPSLRPIREVARTKPEFCDLLKTPLMLNTAVTAYQGRLPEPFPEGSTTDSLKKQMFTYYLDQMLLGLEKQARIRMRRQLHWLAQQMQQHRPSVFYLERLQPEWLPDGKLRRFYIWLGVRLPGILIGFLLACLINSFFFHHHISDLLVHSLPGALVGGLLSIRYPSQSWQNQLQKGSSPLAVLRSATLFGGSLAIILIFIDLNVNNPFSFFGGLIFGTWSLLLILLLHAKQLFSQTGNFRSMRLPSVGKHLWNSILMADPWSDGLLMGLLAGLSWGLIRALTDGPGEGLSAGLSFGLSYTVSGILIGSILKKQSIRVPPVERIDLSLRKLWRSLTNREHFRTILFIGIATFLLFGLSYGLSYGLRYGLSYAWIYGGSFAVVYSLGSAANYWFLIGLFQGLSRDTMPDEEVSDVPNDGIRRSGRNGLYLGLIGGMISAFIAGITIMLSLWLTDTYALSIDKPINILFDGLYWGAITGMITFVTGGIVIGLLKGGMTWWRHWILRLLLLGYGIIPWHYESLLEEACRYNLLCKEGREGYRFFHGLFQDYCASLDTDED